MIFPKIINNISIIAKIISNIFIIYLFYFQINKNITIYYCNQHFTGMPEYIKHMILDTLQYKINIIYTTLL